MSKLIREIIKDDVPIIIELLQQVLGSGDYLSLSRCKFHAESYTCTAF